MLRLKQTLWKGSSVSTVFIVACVRACVGTEGEKENSAVIKENIVLHSRSWGAISPWQMEACVPVKYMVWPTLTSPRRPGRLCTRGRGSPKRAILSSRDGDNVMANFQGREVFSRVAFRYWLLGYGG